MVPTGKDYGLTQSSFMPPMATINRFSPLTNRGLMNTVVENRCRFLLEHTAASVQ
jgi:hypothetical protein